MTTSLLFQTIDQLSREKGIDPQIIISAVEDAILAASRKFYKTSEDLQSHFNKETGLVEYRFRPDSFEVRHVIAAGQITVGMDELLPPKQG